MYPSLYILSSDEILQSGSVVTRVWEERWDSQLFFFKTCVFVSSYYIKCLKFSMGLEQCLDVTENED